MKSRTTASILSFLLGGLGVHRFYLGQIGLGILYLVFCWTFIPVIVALVDCIIFLRNTDEQFDKKYNKGKIQDNNLVINTKVDTEISPYRATHFYPTLAGFQYHSASEVEDKLIPGTPLLLRRDMYNQVDKNAIEVYYNDHKLGFLPKEYANSFASQMDRGDEIDAKVHSYDPTQSDYYKVRIELIDLNYFSKIRRVIKDSDIEY